MQVDGKRRGTGADKGHRQNPMAWREKKWGVADGIGWRPRYLHLTSYQNEGGKE